MDPTVGWEEPHREEEGMCVHAREVENGGPLTPPGRAEGEMPRPFSTPSSSTGPWSADSRPTRHVPPRK